MSEHMGPNTPPSDPSATAVELDAARQWLERNSTSAAAFNGQHHVAALLAIIDAAALSAQPHRPETGEPLGSCDVTAQPHPLNENFCVHWTPAAQPHRRPESEDK
jgi:hypothetical protein